MSAILACSRTTVCNVSRPIVICRLMSGGDAGAIRDAGGAFAQKEKAVENQYFYRMQKHQLEGLRNHLHEEIEHHEHSIKRHAEAIKRHKKRMKQLEEDEAKGKKK